MVSAALFGLGVVIQTWGFGVMWPISAACVLLGLLGILGTRRPAVGAEG